MTRLPGESAQRALVLNILSWIGAAVGVLFIVACALGLFEFARELRRGDSTARVMLGVDVWLFGLSVVFSSWLILRAIRLPARRMMGFVLAGLIAGSSVVGLALNNSG